MDDDPDRDGSRLEIPSERSSAAGKALGAAVRFWWVSMLRGGLALLLGIGAVFSGASEQHLINFIAVYWLLGGVLTAKWALGVRWRTGSRIGLAAGGLAIGTGLVLLTRHAVADVVSAEVLVNLVAVTTIATGGLRLAGAFEIEEHTGHRWTIGWIVLGSIEICIGVVLFVARDVQASTLRITIGVWGLAAGILLLIQGARMLRARRAMD